MKSRFNSFSNDDFFSFFKLKVFTESNSRFHENDRKFFKRVESTVGKGDIARYEQFAFSLSVFKTLILQTCKNQGFGKGLKTVVMKFKFPLHIMCVNISDILCEKGGLMHL